METPEPHWIGLAEAAARYDEGTVSTSGEAPAYLAALVLAKTLVGRFGDTGVEISSDALEVLIDRDLESFIRQGDDEEELNA